MEILDSSWPSQKVALESCRDWVLRKRVALAKLPDTMPPRAFVSFLYNSKHNNDGSLGKEQNFKTLRFVHVDVESTARESDLIGISDVVPTSWSSPRDANLR